MLIALLLSAAVSSCNRNPQYPAVLETADSLAYVNPDSAVTLLRSVGAEMSASSPAVHHLYDLLTIKAQDKADLPLTSDSLILDILQYYEHGGDPNKLPEAYYYAGRVYSELGDAPQAIDYFQKAQTTLDALDLRKLPASHAQRYEKLRGIILAQEGYLFKNQHLYRESQDCFRQAFVLDSIDCDTVGMYKSLHDIGQVLYTAGDHEQALLYFESAEQMAGIFGDSLIQNYLIVQKCRCLVKLKRYDEVTILLSSFKPIFNRANFEVYNSLFGEYYWKKGESEKATPYFAKLLESGSIYARSNATLWFSDYETKRGNAKEALRYMAEFSNLELELRKLRNEEVTALTSSLYNYHLREQENLRLKVRQEALKSRVWHLSAIVILLACALFFLFRYMRIRQRYMKARNEHLNHILISMQADKEDRQRMLQTQAAQLRNSEIHQRIAENCANNKSMKDDDWLEVEKTLNEITPDFIPTLRSVYDFSDIEWKMSLLTKFGFLPPEIGIAINRSTVAVYSARSRLFQKVFNGATTFKDWQAFINSL